MLLGLVAIVLGLEAGLRLLRPQMADLVYDARRTGGHPVIFSDTGWRLRPGNAPPEPPTILGLGDSTTFGTGVAAEETWPLRLPAYLEGESATANAGQRGGDLRQISSGLEELWSTPPPQTVILLVTSNMIGFTEFRRGKPGLGIPQVVEATRRQAARPQTLKDQLSATIRGSALWKVLNGSVESLKYALGLLTHRADPNDPLSPLLAYGWQQPDLPAGYSQRMWENFELELAKLNRLAKRNDICVIVGFLPSRFMLSERLADNVKFVPKSRLSVDAPKRLGQIAADFDLPYLDLTEAFRAARAEHPPYTHPYYIPYDYTHLDAAGHDLVARSLAEFLNTGDRCT
ncbi:hypothetical protein RA27_09280 [Ruegeria sp. ANG-R]|nr:hypothetical protein RA27_09280 [Ruegeria sp. ANG-R]